MATNNNTPCKFPPRRRTRLWGKRKNWGLTPPPSTLCLLRGGRETRRYQSTLGRSETSRPTGYYRPAQPATPEQDDEEAEQHRKRDHRDVDSVLLATIELPIPAPGRTGCQSTRFATYVSPKPNPYKRKKISVSLPHRPPAGRPPVHPLSSAKSVCVMDGCRSGISILVVAATTRARLSRYRHTPPNDVMAAWNKTQPPPPPQVQPNSVMTGTG